MLIEMVEGEIRSPYVDGHGQLLQDFMAVWCNKSVEIGEMRETRRGGRSKRELRCAMWFFWRSYHM